MDTVKETQKAIAALTNCFPSSLSMEALGERTLQAFQMTKEFQTVEIRWQYNEAGNHEIGFEIVEGRHCWAAASRRARTWMGPSGSTWSSQTGKPPASRAAKALALTEAPHPNEEIATLIRARFENGRW